MEINYPTTGDADLSARVDAMWDDTNLYLAATIVDNVHANANAAQDMWQGDSWQIAFDADNDHTVGAYDTDGDYEVGFAQLAGGPSTMRWTAPGGAPAWNPTFAVAQSGAGGLIIEAAIPWSQLPQFTPAVGRSMGVTFLVNDDDGAGRKGFVQWTPGIGLGKDPSKFGTLVLDGFAPDGGQTDTGPTDTGPTDATTVGDSSGDGDHGIGHDTGVVADAGTPADTGTTGDTAVTHDTGGVTDTGGYDPTDGSGGTHTDAGKQPSVTGEESGGCSCSVLGL